MNANLAVLNISEHRAGGIQAAVCPSRCSSCNLRELCLPCGLQGLDINRMDELIFTRRRIKRGESLYRAGDPFKSLHAVRTGFFKSVVITDDGREQVTGFQMGGELIGLDGIDSDRHRLTLIALEDSEVCVIPFSHLERMSAEIPLLQRQLHKVMSREIVREQSVMMLLGAMSAEERVSAFLLNLSQRLAARGYSALEFNLRMTREDIGSYLGLTIETVSRTFSRMQDQGLIAVKQRLIAIADMPSLKKVLIRQSH